MRLSAIYTIYNEQDYIEYSLRSIYDEVDEIVICLVTGQPWFGDAREPDRTKDIIENFKDYKNKITLITGEWKSEPDQRNEALDRLKGKADYCLIVDGDEIYDRDHLRNLKKVVEQNPHLGQIRVTMNTYWKSPFYRIDPPEPYKQLIMTRVTPSTTFIDLRQTNEEPTGLVPPEIAIMYHFSYAKESEIIKKKMENFSHADEILPGWFENVWLKWDEDHDLRNLHPTHPDCYERAIYEDASHLPKVMQNHPFVIDGLNGIKDPSIS